jgi:hypothetical protein
VVGWAFKVKLTTAETLRPPGYPVGNLKGEVLQQLVADSDPQTKNFFKGIFTHFSMFRVGVPFVLYHFTDHTFALSGVHLGELG